MDKYRIRPATAQDLTTVLHHRKRMFEDMGYNDPQSIEEMMKVSTSFLQRSFEEEAYHGWLVESFEGDVVAGGGIIFLDFQSNPRDPQPKRAWVVNMFTEPEHRRRGLARLLMNTMLEWCRNRGMKSLYLHASTEGRPLYESLGFKPTNEMRITL